MAFLTTENIALSNRKIYYQIKYYKNLFFDLLKIRITLMVAVTTIVGYILFSSYIDFKTGIVTFAVFVLACGASVLNEYHERHTDMLMERTKSRPIPSGKISPLSALLISILLISTGLIILTSINIKLFFLGSFTLFWYNFVYTPLKYKFALAIIPGSLVGALPPIIGWVAAGGNIFSINILLLSLFLFIWQIPHFWLLLLVYDKDYKKGGVPTITNIFSESQIAKYTFGLIVFLILFSFTLINKSISLNVFNIFSFILLGVSLLVKTSKILFNSNKMIYKKTFLYINVYILFILLVIVFDKTI